MTTKVIDGRKMVCREFTVTFSVNIEEHSYLEWRTNNITDEAIQEAGRLTLLDIIAPALEKGNEGYQTTMIEVAK
jgi:hypothetical protein